MSSKHFAIGILLVLCALSATGQRIVVDSTSSSNYLIKRAPTKQITSQPPTEDVSFGDRAMSIGKGILNRLKARLNLEEATESIKQKKNRLIGKDEEEKEAAKDG